MNVGEISNRPAHSPLEAFLLSEVKRLRHNVKLATENCDYLREEFGKTLKTNTFHIKELLRSIEEERNKQESLKKRNDALVKANRALRSEMEKERPTRLYVTGPVLGRDGYYVLDCSTETKEASVKVNLVSYEKKRPVYKGRNRKKWLKDKISLRENLKEVEDHLECFWTEYESEEPYWPYWSEEPFGNDYYVIEEKEEQEEQEEQEAWDEYCFNSMLEDYQTSEGD